MFLAAGTTDMSVFAGIRHAASTIPSVADFNVQIGRIRSRFFHRRSGLASGSGIGANDNVVCDEITKLVVSVEVQVVGACHMEANGTVE